ncbi:uncharacterized protein LOC117893630 [Drosophila subobscura]|uniref:uncharacterized protein LOC117893630 n=1 Tax=Drosophila subobscura TaxID=7241 RepID=UPI00155AF920|nr:uncharacterized protein LOC117893630 [Drosophila subobscura]
MSRIHWLWKALQVFRFIFHSFGLLQLRFSRTQRLFTHRYNCFRYIPFIFVVCILILHQLARNRLEIENSMMNTLEIESRPPADRFRLKCEYLRSLMYFMAMIWALVRHKSLWHLINQSQMAYKQLRTLLGRHLILECTWRTLIYGGILLLLLSLMGYNIFCLDFPLIEDATNARKIYSAKEIYNITNYLMGIPRLILVLLIALHILYHLLYAGWLQSLQNLRLDRNLKCFQLLLRMIFPVQKRANLLAGFYFRVSYDCFVFLIAIRIVEFLRLLRFDSNELLQQQKSRDDLEDEAAWNGKSFEDLPTPTERLRESIYLLSWHLALWLLLLAAAQLQQWEYQTLMDNCWQIKFEETKNNFELKKINSEQRKTGMSSHLDIIDIMFHSQISIFDHQRISICFVSGRLKKQTSFLTLNTILVHCKLLLNIVICTAIVYFVQQAEITELQSYLGQRDHSTNRGTN